MVAQLLSGCFVSCSGKVSQGAAVRNCGGSAVSFRDLKKVAGLLEVAIAVHTGEEGARDCDKTALLALGSLAMAHAPFKLTRSELGRDLLPWGASQTVADLLQ
jgi:hypothetical protein